MIPTHPRTSLWSRTHWSYRYLLLVWLADAVSKIAITHSLELGTGHLFVRSGWGVGVLWVEHGAAPYFGWGFALAAFVFWIVMVVIIEREKHPPPEGLSRGIQLVVAGAIANMVDAGLDQSVVNWMAVVTPWVNKAFNIADLALTFGGIDYLIGFIRLIVPDIVRRSRLKKSETEEG